MPARDEAQPRVTAHGFVVMHELVAHRIRWPWLTLMIATAALGIHAWPGAVELLAYDKAAVAGGEVWRVVTGHLTHWSLDHLTWDVVAFVVLGVLAERRGRWRMAATLATSALIISGWVWVAEPALSSYRGLSGVDSALFVLVAVALWRGASIRRRWLMGGVLAAFAGKVVAEVALGHTLFVDSAASGFVPVPMAHLLGGVVGLVAGVWRVAACRSARVAVRYTVGP